MKCIIQCTAILALATGFSTTSVTASENRPNVLFIAIDDMRPQLGCYGDPTVKTPNMDRLASKGIVFDRAYCQQALCSPSRISLLSGRYPSTTQIFSIGPELRSTLPDVVTLPQHFKNQGYLTRSLGKVYHVGIDDPASWSVPSWQSTKPRYGPAGTEMVRQAAMALKKSGKPEPDRGAGRSFYAGPAFEGPEVDDADLLDGDTAREAINALEELASQPDQPFFLAVGFANPHVPWVSPRKYWNLYDPEQIPLAPNPFLPKDAPSFAAKSGDDFFWYGNVPGDRVLPESFQRQCLQGYLAAISYIDAQVGLLLDSLDTLSLEEDTIVVLWGDHGYYMGEHSWWGGKHNNYEGATRVALIIVAPGQSQPGSRTESLVEFVDIAPTLTELCHLPAEPGFEGQSLKPLLTDSNATVKEAALSWYPKGQFMGNALRTQRYRYVEWINREGEVVARELYDHVADPQENVNVAIEQSSQEILRDLGNQLRRLGRIAKAR